MIRAPRLPVGAGFARDAITMAPTFLVPGAASLAVVPILFAILGPEDFGRYALAVAIANGAPQFAVGWLESATLRFGHRPDVARVGARWVIGVTLAAVGGAVAAALFVPPSGSLFILATAGLTAATALYQLVVAQAQAAMRFATASWLATARSIGGLVVMTGIAAASREVAAVLVGFAATIGLSSVLALGAVRPARPMRLAADPAPRQGVVLAPMSSHVVRHGAAFDVSSVVLALATYILSVGDRFVLAAVRPLVDVGVYAATYWIADLALRLVPSVLYATARPRIFRSWDAGDTGGAVRLAGLSVSGAAWVACWIGLLLITGAFAGLLPLQSVLLGPIVAGLIAYFTASGLAMIMTAAGWQTRLAVAFGLAAAVNLAANAVLAPIYGSTGAAAATFVSYALLAGLTGITLVGRTVFRLWSRPEFLGAALCVVVVAVTPLADRLVGFGLLGLGLACLVVTARPATRTLRSLLEAGSGQAAG